MDGRVARSERSRRAIVAAHLALIDEGDLRPTGERIAERAGLWARSLWTNFKDMEALYAATGALVNERRDALHQPIPRTCRWSSGWPCSARSGPRRWRCWRPRRGHPHCASRSRWRCGTTGRPTIARARADREETFAAELALADRDGLLNALTVACTWSAWSMQRDILHLPVADARASMQRMVWALLTAPRSGR